MLSAAAAAIPYCRRIICADGTGGSPFATLRGSARLAATEAWARIDLAPVDEAPATPGDVPPYLILNVEYFDAADFGEAKLVGEALLVFVPAVRTTRRSPTILVFSAENPVFPDYPTLEKSLSLAQFQNLFLLARQRIMRCATKRSVPP